MKDLIIKAKEGDSIATETIISKYMPLILSEASKYHIPGYEFDDLVQHSILSIIKAINLYNINSNSFSSFLATTVKRSNINLLKSKIKHNREIQDSTNINNVEGNYPFTVEDQYIAYEIVEKLSEGINELSCLERMLIIEFYINRRPLKVIAMENSINYQKAYEIKKSALNKLKKQIEVVYIDKV
ncbi:sigma-70 family RNA polymerase sigma factor [Clostridium grantii]|uniref:RNA polymerase sigma factor, sigma-70 family n=1 Tax=Clostridium grantii DSM 8605 TaxID=1121316 RepID=A0A1M5RFA4_9CLOT|nr:sigma-70 family RNA polymerase sigma factor [Clostridium grantii]SHH24453.1 RNA polymerase sigma factor, sigma-70 family [Clostridium grantii DSM 8605]